MKMQETPENIPTGEIPRSAQLYCDKNLVNRVTPGTRLSLVGILNVFDKKEKDNIRNAFIKVLGILII